MRTIRVAMTVAGLAVIGTVTAAPASADHYSGLNRAGDLCYLGASDAGIGQAVVSDDVKVLRQRGEVWTGYVCRFDNIPTETYWGEDVLVWELPDTAVTRTVSCWRPEPLHDIGMGTGTGRLVITPNGKATLTCHFEPEWMPAIPV